MTGCPDGLVAAVVMPWLDLHELARGGQDPLQSRQPLLSQGCFAVEVDVLARLLVKLQEQRVQETSSSRRLRAPATARPRLTNAIDRHRCRCLGRVADVQLRWD